MLKRRAGTVIAACTLALSLAGCESLSDFSIDPTEWFSGELFSTKKKLSGERKPVFPEGVPGVSRGVPPELVKGYQASPDADQDDSLAQQAGGDDQSKAKQKPKPKPKVAAKPAPAETPSRPTAITVRRSDAPTGQQQPAGEQWPDPTPPRQQPGAVQWPDAPRPGTGAVQWPDPPSTR
jgi:hypothetical protein